MEDVVGSVFDLMGRTADPLQEEEVIGERVDIIFEVHQQGFFGASIQENLRKYLRGFLSFSIFKLSFWIFRRNFCLLKLRFCIF